MSNHPSFPAINSATASACALASSNNNKRREPYPSSVAEERENQYKLSGAGECAWTRLPLLLRPSEFQSAFATPPDALLKFRATRCSSTRFRRWMVASLPRSLRALASRAGNVVVSVVGSTCGFSNDWGMPCVIRCERIDAETWMFYKGAQALGWSVNITWHEHFTLSFQTLKLSHTALRANLLKITLIGNCSVAS